MRLLKKIKKFVCGSSLILLCADLSAQSEISEVLKPDKPVWETSAKDLVSKFPEKKLFQWIDSSKTGLRYADDTSPDKMIFAGLPVYEAIFSIKNEKISRIYLSLFNRGDADRV